MKTIIIIGADGYLGWPTCVHLAANGYRVVAVDNYIKREWERRGGNAPLVPIELLERRVASWNAAHAGKQIDCHIGDVCDPAFVDELLRLYQPEAVIHYGEQRSAPFSMASRRNALETNRNNTTGTLNLLWSIRENAPDCHLIKLGSMGEYGTPDCDIPEGEFEVEFRGRKTVLPFPCQPGSIYHASKVADSTYQRLLARVWNLRITDLNQGVVWGTKIPELEGAKEGFGTVFHYDGTWGTALNRFIAQAVARLPITPYGSGNQTRGFLHLQDTVNCVRIAIENPASPGKMDVVNQFTEQFSVNELAGYVAKLTGAKIARIENPRFESEDHYYKADHQKVLDRGLSPSLLSEQGIRSEYHFVNSNITRINRRLVDPVVKWR